jgi:predicted ester cyclase
MIEIASFAERYTAAWNSKDPARVASFYAATGSLTINGGAPSAGRAAITESARAFMTDFPDLRVIMDGLERKGQRVIFRWTLLGTNTGPGGTGRKVKISGFEDWKLGEEFIEESQGHFDSDDYQRQLGG